MVLTNDPNLQIVEQAQAKTEQVHQQPKQAQAGAQKLAAKLRELGLAPDNL